MVVMYAALRCNFCGSRRMMKTDRVRWVWKA
jgi:DNA-directed RNA polymerase subunit RPC12/RpoP